MSVFVKYMHACVCGGEMENTGVVYPSRQKPFTGLLNTEQEETDRGAERKQNWVWVR